MFVSPVSRESYFRRGSNRLLILKQPLQHAQCGVKRGAAALWRFAVPAAVLQLFVQETLHEALRRASEVRSDCERTAIDTWLLFAFEERVPAGLGWPQLPAPSQVIPPEA